jgi:hypothetical protein
MYSFFSVVVWIRIRIDLALLDPDPYWEGRSGSSSKEINQNILENLISTLSNSNRLIFLTS